jgi:hypothetical protein
MITKWRLWAFDNVRNVHELKRKAIESQLIGSDGSFFEKTEIRSAAEKDKWTSLQSKFDVQDVYTEDVSAPNEVIIYYSKTQARFQIGFMILLVGFGFYFGAKADSIFVEIIIGAGALFSGYTGISHLLNKTPQIIINDKGIQTVKAPFAAWPDIIGDEVVTKQQGRSSVTYLEYAYPGGSESINIGELDIKKTLLENLLHTYRVRSEKKISHSSTPITY